MPRREGVENAVVEKDPDGFHHLALLDLDRPEDALRDDDSCCRVGDFQARVFDVLGSAVDFDARPGTSVQSRKATSVSEPWTWMFHPVTVSPSRVSRPPMFPSDGNPVISQAS